MDDRIHKVFHSGRQKIRTDVSDFLEELEVATRQAVALDRQHIIDQERAAFEALQDWRLWAQKTLALVLGGQVEDFEVVPYTDQGLRDRLNTIPIQRASAPRQEAFRPKVDPKPVFREAPLEAHPWGNLGAKIYDAATRAFPMAAQPFILGTANTGGGVIVNLRNKNGQLLAMAQAGAIDTAMGNLWSTLEAMPRESTTTRVVVEEPHGNVLPREPGNLNDPPPGYRGAQTADEKLEAAPSSRVGSQGQEDRRPSPRQEDRRDDGAGQVLHHRRGCLAPEPQRTEEPHRDFHRVSQGPQGMSATDNRITFLDEMAKLGKALLFIVEACPTDSTSPSLKLLAHRVLWARISGNLERCGSVLGEVESRADPGWENGPATMRRAAARAQLQLTLTAYFKCADAVLATFDLQVDS